MKELTFKPSGKELLFQFSKDEIWNFSFVNPRFHEHDIHCHGSHHEDAFFIKKETNSEWGVYVDWEKIQMESAEEEVQITVLYGTAPKRKESYRVLYPQKSLSKENMECKLSPSEAQWGQTERVCTLSIGLKQGLQPWMYKDTQFHFSGKSFLPLTGDSTTQFELVSNLIIDIRHCEYLEPISKDKTEQISLSFSSFLLDIPFKFTPRPYDYKPRFIRSNGTFYAGSESGDIGYLVFDKRDELCPNLCKVNFNTHSSFDERDILDFSRNESADNWKVSFKDGFNPEQLINGATIDVEVATESGDLIGALQIIFGSDPVQEDNYIQIKWPELYPAKCEVLYVDDLNNITFPHPDEPRVIKLMDMKFSKKESPNVAWDTNQKIKISSPFSFGDTKKKSLTEGECVSIYLNFNELDGVDFRTVNIEEPIQLTVDIQHSGLHHAQESVKLPYRNDAEIYLEVPVITICPINEKGKRVVLMKVDEHAYELKENCNPDDIEVDVIRKKISQPSDDANAILVGNLSLRNDAKIPYKGNGISVYVQDILLVCSNVNVIHEQTCRFKEQEFIIQNGADDVHIPIYVDIEKWKEQNTNNVFQFTVKLKPNVNSDQISIYGVDFYPSIEFSEGVFALDLGTTGIVVAKDSEGDISCIKLNEVKTSSIEKDEFILSSLSMIKGGVERSEFHLAPAVYDYYKQQSNDMSPMYRLVPLKFMIGQEQIPYLTEFYSSDASKNVRFPSMGKKEINMSISTNSNKKLSKRENENTVLEFVKMVYREIFSRGKESIDKISKLVVTYPNTYTIDNIECIKDVLSEELGFKLPTQICFVPESDAVAAYYFHQRVIFDNGFLDASGRPIEKENIIFYDMGAGTLDLSLVSFTQKRDNITATIVNKIGIPLAGNYLDYLIFHSLLSEKWVKESLINDSQAIKEITTNIKENYDSEKTIEELAPQWLQEYQDYFVDKNIEVFIKKKYKALFDASISDYLEKCSTVALDCLVPKGMRVHRIVFSGRASQFKPIRKKVLNVLKENGNSNVRVDELKGTRNGNSLKTSVAIGALRYATFFNGDSNYQIQNKNLFAKIAVIYWGKLDNGTFDVNVKYLVDPINADWSKSAFINGTYCLNFEADETITNALQGVAYFVQTYLNDDNLKELYRHRYRNDQRVMEDLRWAFVNELFKTRISDGVYYPIKLKITKDNKIVEREICGEIRTDMKLLEDIENNILYKKSMWPFITKLN